VAIVLAGCQSDDGTTPTASNTTNAAGLADLVGARGAGGETELQARGYQLARTEGLTAYWWNPSSSSCARVVTADGRYQSVDPVPATQCGQSAGTTTAASTTAGGPPPDLVNFVGAKGGQAEMGLQNLGYTAARTQGLTTYWWNQSTGVCARIVTSDGRYQTINSVAPSDCQA
jgi:hypothetical protein